MYSLSEKVYLKMKKAWEYQISVLKNIFICYIQCFSVLCSSLPLKFCLMPDQEATFALFEQLLYPLIHRYIKI